MNHISIFFGLAVMFFGCTKLPSFTFASYNSTSNVLSFKTHTMKGRILGVKNVPLRGVNYFNQQNKVLLVSAVDDAYNQSQLIFLFDTQINSLNFRESDTSEIITNRNDFFALKLANTSEDISMSRYIVGNAKNLYAVVVRGDTIAVPDGAPPDLFLLNRRLDFKNECFDIWTTELELLDLKKRQIKGISTLLQSDYNSDKDWLPGYSYFKNPYDCFFSNYRFQNDSIVQRIFLYEVRTGVVKLFREFSFPSKDFSVSKVIFRVREDGSILATQGRDIFLIDSNVKLLYKETNGEIVYLN